MTAALIDSNGHPASNALPPRRVPAWKKLGLKLKFAEEITDPPEKKRPREQKSQNLPEAAHIEHSLSKRPRLNPPNAQSTKFNATKNKSLAPSLKRDTNSVRKTVSFTSDTKVEDGDSSKSLIADWEAQYDQPAAKPLKKTESTIPRASRAKKSKGRHSTKKPHAALEYLTHFRRSRETWKFSKNREIWILKHMFSTDDIPSDYDTPLSHYLQGLKSASARSRIRQAGEAIVQKDREEQIEYIASGAKEAGAGALEEVPAGMENPEVRRAYYEDSVSRYKRKLEQHLNEVAEEELNWVSPERLTKRRRAELTLWAIGITPSSTEPTQSSDATISDRVASRDGSSSTTESGIPKRNTTKKRKNRTSVIDVSSSSDEDESGDSSDESDDDGEQDRAGESNTDRCTSTTTARTQSSMLSETSVSDSEEDTESTSNSDAGFDDSDSDSEPKNTTMTNGRPRSIISISS